MSDALRPIELPAAALAVIREGTVGSRSGSPSTGTQPPSPNNQVPELNRGAQPLHPSNSETQVHDAPGEESILAVSNAKSKNRREAEPEPLPAPFSSAITVRVPQDIPSRLLRAATDRKLARLRPCTQQEIVAEAVGQWLNRNGF